MMSERKKPLLPVKPSGLELVFFYACPGCRRNLPVVSPTQPTMVRCEACGVQFPIVPVDEKGVRFMKLITASGNAAVDPDFL
jgi:hypothetical protein